MNASYYAAGGKPEPVSQRAAPSVAEGQQKPMFSGECPVTEEDKAHLMQMFGEPEVGSGLKEASEETTRVLKKVREVAGDSARYAWDRIAEIQQLLSSHAPESESASSSPKYDPQSWMEAFARFRRQLRQVLFEKGIRTNPGNADEELIEMVRSLALKPDKQLDAAKVEEIARRISLECFGHPDCIDLPAIKRILTEALASVPCPKQELEEK